VFNRNDFPDLMTEAAWIRERHGPPQEAPNQAEERIAAWQKLKRAIVELYQNGATISTISRAFHDVSNYRNSTIYRRGQLYATLS
jgi:hypothetical protein